MVPPTSTLPLAIAIMAMMIIVVGGTIRIYDAGESCLIGLNVLVRGDLMYQREDQDLV